MGRSRNALRTRSLTWAFTLADTRTVQAQGALPSLYRLFGVWMRVAASLTDQPPYSADRRGQRLGGHRVSPNGGRMGRKGVVPGVRGGGVLMTGMVGSVTRQRYDELVQPRRDDEQRPVAARGRGPGDLPSPSGGRLHVHGRLRMVDEVVDQPVEEAREVP